MAELKIMHGRVIRIYKKIYTCMHTHTPVTSTVKRKQSKGAPSYNATFDEVNSITFLDTK